VKLLGTDLDTVIAKRIGCSKRQVQKARDAQGIKARRPRRLWTAEESTLLGTMSDCELAKRLNRSHTVVSKQRRLLGIRVFVPDDLRNTKWTRAEISLLAKYDDLQVARMTGKRVRVVAAKRASTSL
jgi:hypothetical protein